MPPDDGYRHRAGPALWRLGGPLRLRVSCRDGLGALGLRHARGGARARDASRHRRFAQNVALPEEDSPDALAVDSREEMRIEGRTDLARAMAHLDDRQRELLWLAYAQGASHNEIAAELGLKSQSVRTLLFRARQKLAGLLKGGLHHE